MKTFIFSVLIFMQSFACFGAAEESKSDENFTSHLILQLKEEKQ